MPLNLTKGVDVVKKEAGLNLIKKAQAVGLTRQDLRSQVKFVLDVSGSTAPLYRQRIMHAIATRVAGLAMVVDDNGSAQVYALNKGVHRIKYELTSANLDTYVRDYIEPLVGGETNYAPTLMAILEDIEVGDPVFVAFFTDGENYDPGQAEDAIRLLSHNPVFIQFVGISVQGGTRFPFLEKLNDLPGRHIDNAGFVTFNVAKDTDDDLYNGLMNEYPKFVVEARKKGMLPWTKVVRPQPQQPQKRSGLFGRR